MDEGLHEAAYRLSTLAAAVNWHGGRNTSEWLKDLKHAISAVQAFGRPGGVCAGMNMSDAGIDRLIREAKRNEEGEL